MHDLKIILIKKKYKSFTPEIYLSNRKSSLLIRWFSMLKSEMKQERFHLKVKIFSKVKDSIHSHQVSPLPFQFWCSCDFENVSSLRRVLFLLFQTSFVPISNTGSVSRQV